MDCISPYSYSNESVLLSLLNNAIDDVIDNIIDPEIDHVITVITS